MTTWAGFLYIGTVAQRRHWLMASAAYGASVVVWLLLTVVAPTDDSGEMIYGTWQDNLGTAILLITWFIGIIHSLLANRTWLTLRAKGLSGAR
jgi:hypothetical protein